MSHRLYWYDYIYISISKYIGVNIYIGFWSPVFCITSIINTYAIYMVSFTWPIGNDFKLTTS